MTTQTTTTVQVGDQGDTGRAQPPAVATQTVTDNSKPSAPVTTTVQVGDAGNTVQTASAAGPLVPPVQTQTVTTNY